MPNNEHEKHDTPMDALSETHRKDVMKDFHDHILSCHLPSPPCHPERSEGSPGTSSQSLLGVYPERSEWAQDDKSFVENHQHTRTNSHSYFEGYSDIEISDVPSDELPMVPNVLITLGSHFSPRSLLWRWTTIVGAILLVLLVLFNNFPTFLFTPAATAVPTPQHVSFMLANPLQPLVLAPAPKNCPSLAPLYNFDPATFPPGVGVSPVWVTGFSGPYARLDKLDDSRQQPQEFGWAYHLLLVEKSDYIRPVVISGESLHDGSPLFFEDGISIRGQKSVTAFFELAADHPRLPSKYDTQWTAWNVIMYVPAAGCYSLETFWPEGGWKVNFAAGR
jgi:hypothetical protein